MIKNVLYTSQACAKGGRNGIVTSDNGVLNLKLNMRNDQQGTNPEQLFAAAYAACFESTLEVMADRSGMKLGSALVTAFVQFGTTTDGGYEIGVRLEVKLSELSPKDAKQVVELAHLHCPFSKATRNNIKVDIQIIDKESSWRAAPAPDL